MGDVGDSNFDHTWVDGLQICKDTTASPVPTAVTSGCPTCGTNKNGKLSCCGRGGSWFGKCGDEGDSTFDHTWIEGLSSCRIALPANAGQQKAKQPEGLQGMVFHEQITTRHADTGSDADAGMVVHANSGALGEITPLVVVYI